MTGTRKKSTPAGRPPDPDFVAIDLTYRCNYSCNFCFLENSSRRVSRGGELGTKELKAFIDSLAGRRREFYIVGGEPSLRGNFTEIVAHIVKGGHRCLVTTNGSRLTLWCTVNRANHARLYEVYKAPKAPGHVMGNVKDGLTAFGGPGYDRFRKTPVRHGGFLPTCSRCGRTSYSAVRGRFLCAAPKERP